MSMRLSSILKICDVGFYGTDSLTNETNDAQLTYVSVCDMSGNGNCPATQQGHQMTKQINTIHSRYHAQLRFILSWLFYY